MTQTSLHPEFATDPFNPDKFVGEVASTIKRLAHSNPGAWLRTYDDALTHYGATPTADDLNF